MKTAIVLGVSLLALGSPLSAAEPSGAIPAGVDFGAGLTLKETQDLADVVAHPERYAEGPILLTGHISDVCQRRGCWTILRQEQSTVRVRFKDYSFFLPRDSSGKQAWVEGVVKLTELTEEMARHYARETKGSDPSDIRGPQREVGFTASGVRLIDRK